MKITLEVVPVLLPCLHQQNNDETQYYAFEVVGMVGKYGSKVILRAPECQYPGNDVVREFISKACKP